MILLFFDQWRRAMPRDTITAFKASYERIGHSIS